MVSPSVNGKVPIATLKQACKNEGGSAWSYLADMWETRGFFTIDSVCKCTKKCEILKKIFSHMVFHN